MNCPRCGAPVNVRAQRCPHCGQPLVPQTQGGSEKSTRITLFVVFGAVACVLALLAVLVLSNGNIGSSGGGSETFQAQTQKSGSQGTGASQDAGQAKEAVPAKPAKKETDPVMKACEDEARAYFENLGEQHAELRAQLEGSGMQTFEGTLIILSGEDVCALSGIPINANGDSCEQEWRSSQYALLKFDAPTHIHDIFFADEVIEGDYSYLSLGDNSYGNNSLDYWREFEGKRICVASSMIGLSSGVDLRSWPASDAAWVVYQVRSSSVEQMLNHDFNHMFFFVDVPESWDDEEWSVERIDEMTFKFNQSADGEGSAIITGGNGLPEGYEVLGTVDSGFGLLVRQEGDGVFGDGKATVKVRSYL